MFFTQEAFPEEGEMLMPIPNIEVYWLPELTPKMMGHFSFSYPLMGLKNPLHIHPKNTQITRIQNIWGEIGGQMCLLLLVGFKMWMRDEWTL